MDESLYYGRDRTERMLRERVQDRWMDAYAPLRHIDVSLIVTAILLSVIGMFLIYSASSTRLQLSGDDPAFYVRKQAIALALGLVAMTVAALVDYRWIRVYSPLAYLAALLLLFAVLTPLGATVNGAQRWIVLGGFQLQPSEIAKLTVILALGALLHEQKGDPGIGSVLASLLVVAVPMALVFAEPDLGTAIVFVWITFVLLLVAGVKARYLLGLVAAGVGAIVVVLQRGFIKEYQLGRITAFLDPTSSSLARSLRYQMDQSLIAIGSGQFAGKGFLNGTQNNLAYVPENHTDFIFTVVGEEFGFLGAIVVIGLLAFVMWRGIRTAMLAKDLFGALVASAIVGLLILQVFVNIGMTIGIMPVTGIALPFLSYGGTSLIMWFVFVGLLLNIHMRRF